jgi:hypothetical protein
VKLTGCGWGACAYDVIATNTSGNDLPSGYTVRATITYKAINVNNLMNPAEVKTTTREKAVPRSGLPKGRSIGLGDLTLGSQGQNLGCQATAGP